MKYSIQPNCWSCLPTAVANMLLVDVQDIFEHIKHDGSAIVWPNEEDPWCRRSFHLQEMISYCLSINYAITTVTPTLGLVSRDLDDVHVVNNMTMYEHMLAYYNGIFTGVTDTGTPHAVTWRGQKVIDPSTGGELATEMLFSKFHIVHKISHD